MRLATLGLDERALLLRHAGRRVHVPRQSTRLDDVFTCCPARPAGARGAVGELRPRNPQRVVDLQDRRFVAIRHSVCVRSRNVAQHGIHGLLEHRHRLLPPRELQELAAAGAPSGRSASRNRSSPPAAQPFEHLARRQCTLREACPPGAARLWRESPTAFDSSAQGECRNAAVPVRVRCRYPVRAATCGTDHLIGIVRYGHGVAGGACCAPAPRHGSDEAVYPAHVHPAARPWASSTPRGTRRPKPGREPRHRRRGQRDLAATPSLEAVLERRTLHGQPPSSSRTSCCGATRAGGRRHAHKTTTTSLLALDLTPRLTRLPHRRHRGEASAAASG